MKLSALLIALLLYAIPVSGQSITLAWDHSVDLPMDGFYRVQIGGVFSETRDVGYVSTVQLPLQSWGGYTFGVQSCLADKTCGSSSPVLSATLTAPVPPVPSPQPPEPFRPTITTRNCPVYLEAPLASKPSGTGWVVQYLEIAGETLTPLTTASTTRKRAVVLPLGPHYIRAVWTKAGQSPVWLEALGYPCE